MPESGGIFILDFEEGNTSEFGSSTVDAGMTFEASAAAKAHGSYGLRCVSNGTGNEAYGNKAVSDLTTLYVRLYVYLDSNIQLAQYATCTFISIYDGSTALVSVRGYRGSAGTGALERWYVAGQDLSAANNATNFSLDVWHYVDILWKAGTGADGGATVWIDGSQIFSELNNNLTAYAADNVRVGIIFVVLPNGTYFWIDDVKCAATGPIGVYADASSMSIPIVMAHHGQFSGGMVR